MSKFITYKKEEKTSIGAVQGDEIIDIGDLFNTPDDLLPLVCLLYTSDAADE